MAPVPGSTFELHECTGLPREHSANCGNDVVTATKVVSILTEAVVAVTVVGLPPAPEP